MSRSPARIGRYDLITTLATGGMGRICLARATGPGGFERKVVIKTLELPVDADSEPAIAMFLDEARLLGLLHHQHVASVFEVGRDDDGRHYMVLDYLEGASAHDVWERAVQFGAALPLDFTLTVASAVANGLHYTHTRRNAGGAPLGIVHRDVTPSNVMIGHDGAVKLIDFGIAMAADRRTKTQTGYVKGKVGYLAPEQVAGRDVDARTDVFALGILLYELSTLHRAFREATDLATMQQIKLGKVVRPSQLVPGYPPELEAVVMQALQVDPRDRFGDADAMRRAIEALGHRLHLVLGDAAVIEVMAQLYEAQPDAGQHAASRASEPEFDWAESDRDLTVRRDPAELLAAMRAEIASREIGEAATWSPSPPVPAADVRPRKLRAATEAADALIGQRADAFATPATPSPIVTARPAGAKPAVAEELMAEDPVTEKLVSEKPVGEKPVAGKPLVEKSAVVKSAAAKPAPPKAMLANPPIGANLVRARTQRSPGLRWIGVLGVLGVLGVAGYLVMQDSPPAVAGSASSSPSRGPVQAPAAARTPPESTSPPPLPTALPPPQTPPAAPDQVRVRIVTHPPDVTVSLDGKKLGRTPFDEKVAADPGKHVIKLRRRGYVTHRLDVELTADITQDITLAPASRSK